MAESLRTPTVTPNLVGGNAFVNPETPVSRISSSLLPDGRLKGSITRGMGKLAEGLNAVYQVQAQATAKNMDNRFSQSAQETLYDSNNGYYTKKGKDAVDGYKSAVENLKAGFEQAKQGVDDPFIQRMYDSSTGGRLNSILNQAQQHYNEQLYAWNVSESKARISNLGNVAITTVNSWSDDNGDYMKYHNAVAGEVNDLAKLGGIPQDSERYKELMLDSMTTFHSGALDMFLSKDSVGSASGYLKKFRPEMDAATAAKYEERIHDLAERLQAKAEREAAKRAAMQNQQATPEQILEAINADHLKRRMEIEAKKGKLSSEQYIKEIKAENERYNNLAQGVREGININKANKEGDALRFKASTVEDRLNRYAQEITTGQIQSLDQIFFTKELQEIEDYGLKDYVEGRVFLKDPRSSSKALQKAKSIPNLFTASGREQAAEFLKQMTPDDAQAFNSFYYKRLQGRQTQFDNRLKTGALSLIGITDGKMPKTGSAQYSQYINIADELKSRVDTLVQDIPKSKLTEEKITDCLNQAILEQQQHYTNKGAIWDSNELVPRDEISGKLQIVPDAFVEYNRTNGDSVQLPAEFVEKYAPQIIGDMVNGDALNTGEQFNDRLINLLLAKFNDLKQQNTIETNAIIDK